MRVQDASRTNIIVAIIPGTDMGRTMYRGGYKLGGGFKYLFIFTPCWGKIPILTSIFFKWVGSNTN